MAERLEIYKCEACGNIVEVTHNGVGQLVCCGQPMKLQQEKREDLGQEKHVPVVEKLDDGILVKVGSVEHPMESNHYIEWIEVISENSICRRHLQPGEKPERKFKVTSDNIKVRIYCNVHGLWSI